MSIYDRDIRRIIGNIPYYISGPDVWSNVLLGQTCVWPRKILVYSDSHVEGIYQVGGLDFEIVLRPYPQTITLEWIAIDLLNNYERAFLDLDEAEMHLQRYIRSGELNLALLLRLAEEFGSETTSETTYKLVNQSLL